MSLRSFSSISPVGKVVDDGMMCEDLELVPSTPNMLEIGLHDEEWIWVVKQMTRKRRKEMDTLIFCVVVCLLVCCFNWLIV